MLSDGRSKILITVSLRIIMIIIIIFNIISALSLLGDNENHHTILSDLLGRTKVWPVSYHHHYPQWFIITLIIIFIMTITIMTIIRFVGKDQSVMAATCLSNPDLCLLVKSNGNWFYLQVLSSSSSSSLMTSGFIIAVLILFSNIFICKCVAYLHVRSLVVT